VREYCAQPPDHGSPDPKYAVREGLLTLATGQKRYKDHNPVRVS